jgi:hypothetical protein
MDTLGDQLLTRQEAADRAKVTFQTILLWERSGRLHPSRVREGSEERVLIRASEVDHAAQGSRTPIDPLLIWRPEELAGAGGGDADGGHSKPRLERNSADIARYW